MYLSHINLETRCKLSRRFPRLTSAQLVSHARDASLSILNVSLYWFSTFSSLLSTRSSKSVISICTCPHACVAKLAARLHAAVVALYHSRQAVLAKDDPVSETCLRIEIEIISRINQRSTCEAAIRLHSGRQWHDHMIRHVAGIKKDHAQCR